MSRTKQRKKSSKSKAKVTGCRTVTVWRRVKGKVTKSKGKNKKSCLKKSKKSKK